MDMATEHNEKYITYYGKKGIKITKGTWENGKFKNKNLIYIINIFKHDFIYYFFMD